MVEIYWQLKTLIGRVLLDHLEAHQGVLLQLGYMQLQIKLVDHKLNFIAENMVGMDLSNLYSTQPQFPATAGWNIS